MTPALVDSLIAAAFADTTLKARKPFMDASRGVCLGLLSRHYGQVLYDGRHNRVFRLYTRPLPGLTLAKAKPYFQDPSAIWASPYGKRPVYLQIYDMNAGGKLIHDEPLYHQEVHLMGVDEHNVLWGAAFAQDGEYTSGPVKVLKFQIKE